MLFDTDVLIWCFRGNVRAATVIDRADSREISAVSYMELLQGARNKRELDLIRRFLRESGFLMLPLSETISTRALVYMEEYVLKSGLCMADALIAATSVEHQLTLCTGNPKHFRPISELDLKVFRPDGR